MPSSVYVREYSYPRKYKFVFIWLSNAFLVLLTLSVVYWNLWLILLNFTAYCFTYFFLANLFNKKIFVHSEGKFVYRNVFRRRLSFNLDEIESVKETSVRRGLMIKLKDNRGFVYLTPYWRNWLQLFRFVINHTDPQRVENRDKIIKSFNL